MKDNSEKSSQQFLPAINDGASLQSHMKDILESLKECFGIIAATSAFAASVFGILRFGEWAVLLIAFCSFLLYIGISITIKMIKK